MEKKVQKVQDGICFIVLGLVFASTSELPELKIFASSISTTRTTLLNVIGIWDG